MTKDIDRKNYDTIKQRFALYIKSWNSKDKETVKEIIDSTVLFYTATSLTVGDGGQCSIFGVYDFINDFPPFDQFECYICNYICRFNKINASCYAEVVCKGILDGNIFEFVIPVLTLWKNIEEKWIITHLRQNLIIDDNELLSIIGRYWFVTKTKYIIRGEGDSPWLNIKWFDDSILMENEKIKEVIIKHIFGLEYINFQHCFETVSLNYGMLSYFENHDLIFDKGENRKNLISRLKQQRLKMQKYICPVIFSNIEIDDNRAYVELKQLKGNILSLHSHAFVSSQDENTNDTIFQKPISKKNNYAIAKGYIELIKEQGNWKICYFKLYPGLYPLSFSNNSLYIDEC